MRCSTRISFRLFSTASDTHLTRWMSAASLSVLQEDLRVAGIERISHNEAIELMQHTLSLKRKNDPKFRGKIPIEVTRLVSSSVVDHVQSLSPSDLTTLVVGIGDSDKCVDEFLMYRIARTSEKRLHEFAVSDLVRMAGVYSKRDLEDEKLLIGIADILCESVSPMSQKVSLMRSLSALRIHHEGLIRATIESIEGLSRIHEKDAISLLISFAELDTHCPELTGRLWEAVDKHKLNISHDDEYGLVFAAMWLPTNSEVVDRIVKHAKSENRIRKRIQLFADAIQVGMIQRSPVEGVTPSSRPNQVRSKPRNSYTRNDNDGSISSGLHYEVANVLKSMKLNPQLEVPVSSFIIDTVIE